MAVRPLCVPTPLACSLPSCLPSVQFATLARKVEPVAARMAAVGSTATQKLVGVANKYELTPTPLKKRR